MSNLAIVTRSRLEQVYDRLHELIRSPEMSIGARLQSQRELARRFGTSAPTVQRAMNQLVAEGLLVRRQGAGTFVAQPGPALDLDRSVALCIEVGADVYGDLANQLLRYLHDRNWPVSLFDTSHKKTPQLFDQLATTRASCLVIHGNSHLLKAVEGVDFGGKPIIGVIDWETEREFGQVSRVLCDYRLGAEMVVEHLWKLGHRRLLITGTETQIWFARNPEQAPSALPAASVRAWERLGGEVRFLASSEGPAGAQYEPTRLYPLFEARHGCTAVFALRDTEANAVQRCLRRRLHLIGRFALVGYYDTPWSLSADPPITAVNLNIAEVARLAAKRIAAVQAGEAPPMEPVYVEPRLIVRGTSLRNS